MTSKWEPRKHEIEELYITQKRPLNEVRRIMESERGFSASTIEYERQLRKWNFRKNQRQQHLKLIKARLQVRQQQGKDSEVYLRGILLHKLEIQKKVDRWFVSVVEQHMLQRFKLPPELVVVTPASESYMVFIRSKELPWFCFLQQLNAIENLKMIIKMPEHMLRDMIPNLCPNPSPSISTHLVQLIKHLSAILPVDQDDYIITFLQKIFCGDYHLATIEFLKLVVYTLSNKLIDGAEPEGSFFCDKLLEWFQIGRNYLFVKSILSQNSPTIQAFMENIFASVVFNENEFFLEMFLESGIDPNIRIESFLEPSRKVVPPPNCWDFTPLSYFAGSGNIRLVEMFIDKGAAINHDGGQTALGMAAFNGRIEVAKLLLKRGAAVDSPYSYERTELQLAADAGQLGTATLLLNNGANINAVSNECNCALELAIDAEANDLVKILLDRGADVNIVGKNFRSSPLMLAISKNNHSLVERLLRLGANVNQSENRWYHATALQLASANGSLEICQILIQAGANVNTTRSTYDGNTALDCAVASGNSQLVSFLLEHGAQRSEKATFEEATLEEAVALNDIRMAQALLSAQAYERPDEVFISAIKRKIFEIITTFIEADSSIFPDLGRETLRVAVATGDVELVRLLLDLGACPNDEIRVRDHYYLSNKLLVDAVMLENIPVIQALLDAGVDCNCISSHCNSFPSAALLSVNALQTACFKGSIELVRYLLHNGVDINWPAATYYGYTALQAAVKFGDLELVQFLISKEADVNAPPATDKGGWTALQAAIREKRIDLVHVLLKAGAHPNDAISLESGQSSLQLAAEYGDEFLVQLLLDRGADVNWPPAPKDGRTALQAASENGHYQMV